MSTERAASQSQQQQAATRAASSFRRPRLTHHQKEQIPPTRPPRLLAKVVMVPDEHERRLPRPASMKPHGWRPRCSDAPDSEGHSTCSSCSFSTNTTVTTGNSNSSNSTDRPGSFYGSPIPLDSATPVLDNLNIRQLAPTTEELMTSLTSV